VLNQKKIKKMNSNNAIVGKLILQAKVENISPLLIAGGKSDEVDFEVIKDKNNRPYIPASGFAGMLRNSIFQELKVNDISSSLKHFWGSENAEEKDVSQSHIIIDDLKVDGEYMIVERDSVSINHSTNLGMDPNKFDYELIEPFARFNLNMEITIRKGFNKDEFEQFILFMIEKGKDGSYQQGAFKSSGFGLLRWSDVKIYAFDFPDKNTEWFNFLQSKDANGLTNVYNENRYCTLKRKIKNELTFKGLFHIKNSLIIRNDVAGTNTSKESAPDKIHLCNSLGEPLITGKTFRGALRHRATKILNTIGSMETSGVINNIFGYVDPSDKGAEAIPGKLTTFETVVRDAEESQIQPRVKIDRFTGGTIDPALMQNLPLWHKNERFELQFKIKDCKDYEAGLMLLVMKDLMNEDLAIGGEKAIGRGVLKGESLTISGFINSKDGSEKKECELSFNGDGLVEKSSINEINNWVSELVKY
jgi:CRISPR/Cas system CSM-associated protein Csm3 (group 7 of RAMP superfamily)